MKITKVWQVGCIAYVYTEQMYGNDNYKSEYRRIAKDNWEMLVGKKWEHTYFESLESTYRDYLLEERKQSILDIGVLKELENCYKIIKHLKLELQASLQLLAEKNEIMLQTDAIMRTLIQDVSELELDKANLQLLNVNQASLIEMSYERSNLVKEFIKGYLEA